MLVVADDRSSRESGFRTGGMWMLEILYLQMGVSPKLAVCALYLSD